MVTARLQRSELNELLRADLVQGVGLRRVALRCINCCTLVFRKDAYLGFC